MPDFPDRPGYSFDPGPPREASRFLRNKGLKPSFSWQDVEPEEHANAFAVAKMASRDLLAEAKDVVQKAIDDGMTFAQFQKEWKARPGLREWTGWGEALDPTNGQRKPALLGTPRRLRTIYRSNMRTARAAGQWERIERTKRAMPYLEYRLGPSERHRPHHADKEGLVLLVDDPFWDTWMTPNGWGCNCWVRQLTRRQAERRGISAAAPDVPLRDFENKRTGEIKKVPQGIDPGWERNPGKQRLRTMEDMLAGRIEALGEDAARAAVRDIATSWRAERVLRGAAGGAVPVGVLPQAVAEQLGASKAVVRMSDDYGVKFTSRSRDVTTDTLALLDDALRSGQLAKEIDGGATSLIAISPGPSPWRFVLKILGDEIWVRTIHRTEPRKWRSLIKRPGVEILRE